MNIIFVLNDEKLLDELNQIILALDLDWKVYVINNIQEYKDFSKNFPIDMLLIDFSNKNYEKVLREVENNTPLLKTLTISDDISCSNEKGCMDCITNYNRKRIILPIDAKVLYNTIKDFDNTQCKYYKKFDNILEILPKIIERFVSYSFDKEKNMIYKNTEVSSFYISDMIQITLLLDTHNIKYEVQEDSNIQLI